MFISPIPIKDHDELGHATYGLGWGHAHMSTVQEYTQRTALRHPAITAFATAAAHA